MRMKIFVLFDLLLVMTCVLWGADIELLNGSFVKAKVELQDKSIKTGDKTIALDQIANIVFATDTPQEMENQSRITLIDGSILIAQVTTGDDKLIKIKEDDGKILEIERKNILSISFVDLKDDAKAEIPKLGAYVVLAWGKVLVCKPNWLTFLELGVEHSGQELKLERNVIAEVNFGNTIQKSKETNVVLKSCYGDLLKGKLIKLDEDSAKIITLIGEREFLVKDLLEIEIVSDKVVDLLDLKPAKVDTVAYLDDIILKPTFNSGLFGGYIKKGKKRYTTGICMQSKTTISYVLDGGYSRFGAEISLDERFAFSGNADFVVYGDAKELLRINMNLKTPAKRLDVPIQGFSKITIELDFAELGNSGDFGIWGNPRLYR